MEVFDCLPIAADVGGDYLAVHGGIGPDLQVKEDINQIRRFREPPLGGLFCDLLWSDPAQDNEKVNTMSFKQNVARQCSVRFGLKALK